MAEESNDALGILRAATILNNLSPENPRYPLILAKAHMSLRSLSDSEHFFQIAVRLSPMLTEAHKGLGTLYMHKQEYEKAKICFQRSLDLEQGDVSTLNSLALAYIKQGMLEEGIRRYRMALAINGEDARVHFNLGLALKQKKLMPDARASFQRALAADPNLEKARRQIHIIDDRDKTALEDMEEAELPPLNYLKEA